MKLDCHTVTYILITIKVNKNMSVVNLCNNISYNREPYRNKHRDSILFCFLKKETPADYKKKKFQSRMQIRHVLCGTILNGVSIHFPVHKLFCPKHESLAKRHAQPLTKGTHPLAANTTWRGQLGAYRTTTVTPSCGKDANFVWCNTSNSSIPRLGPSQNGSTESLFLNQNITHYQSLGPRAVYFIAHISIV